MASQDPQEFHWHYSDFDNRNFEIRGRTLFFIVVLFSVILLVTLLFLYARWVCRFNHQDHPPPSSSSSSSSSAASGSAPHRAVTAPTRPRGLDAATINILPTLLHRSSSAATSTVEETECCICLSLFQDGDKLKVLPECQHCYHSKCLDRWLSTQSNCPLCRASLRVDSAADSVVPHIVTE